MNNLSTNRLIQLPSLALVGRYSVGSTAELSGRSVELAALEDLLLTPPRDATYSLVVPGETSPDPYDGFLRYLRIMRSKGLALIQRQESVLLITGSRTNLSGIAAGVLDIRTTHRQPGAHIHLDYYPGHFYLAPESEPLVIVLRERPGGVDAPRLS